MLLYDGYGYVENRQSSKNIFWRCARYRKHQCKARVVTSKDASVDEIRVLDHLHSHPPASIAHNAKYCVTEPDPEPSDEAYLDYTG